jgi:glucose/mannose-6-phosphate isomerase
MEKAILEFAEQFTYVPVIENKDKLKNHDKFVLVGMGGSHLCADILRCAYPAFDFLIHRNYGLPKVPDYFLKDALIILSSYSGETEEVLDAYQEATVKGYDVAIMADGGELLELAKQEGLPYIDLPNPGIEPRSAIGYSTIALAALSGHTDALELLQSLVTVINPESYRSEGEALAQSLDGSIPVVYSSAENYAVVYNWKIKLNETAKLPAFFNVFPELNHNEMSAYNDIGPYTFIFIEDANDHPRVVKRMEVLKAILLERGYTVLTTIMRGETAFERIFGSLLVADFMALTIANKKGIDGAATPLIKEFKEKIRE